MASSITFFPVGNGDMTLIVLGDEASTRILIDCNITGAADDPNNDTRDVAQDLRDRLKRDSKGRPYVDVFLSSHPDQDHCRGIRNHFYLGDPAAYSDDKKPDNEKHILMKEIWSSPIVYRRASKNHTLTADAKALHTEAKRRVQVERDKDFTGIQDGDRIQILGEDESGKTDDLSPILVKIDEDIEKINGAKSKLFKARLLAPFAISADDCDEEELGKNHSSVILNIELADDSSRSTVKRFLTAGDAEVLIWEKLWEKHGAAPKALEYDLLQTPHHCSWHSLSYDSRSELGDKAKVSASAKSALSQIRSGGTIVTSSSPVKDDDRDPPCHAAKVEYESIIKNAKGEFICTGEYPTEAKPTPLEFVVSDQKLAKSVRTASIGAPQVLTKGLIDEIGRKAAEAEAVKKAGNSRYA
jgi:hypothetical protein